MHLNPQKTGLALRYMSPKDVVIGKRHSEIQGHSRCHCEETCEHASGIENSFDHAASLFSAFAEVSWGIRLPSRGTLRSLLQR